MKSPTQLGVGAEVGESQRSAYNCEVTVAPSKTDSLFVVNVDYEGYLKIYEALAPNRIRLTYDGGRLEFLSPSPEHERIKAQFSRALEAIFMGFDIDFLNGGSTTFKSKLLDKGFEPDECYWLTRLDEVADVSAYDPELGPPPDLSIEVDVSESSISRMPIYAAFGVTEVWRYEQDGSLQLYCLQEGGYLPIERSRFLSQVRLDELQHFVDRGKEIITSKLIREVQAWAREKKNADD